MSEARLVENKVIVWDEKEGKKLFDLGWFGKIKDGRLELSLIEAAHLADKKKITLANDKGKKLSLKKFMEKAIEIDPRFSTRYTVYKDLRERGLPTRTGFKFGCDFRVYERGVKPVKKGPKTAKEHTKWIVFAVAEDYSCSFHELSRAVRLAHNIRANMLWAVVDNDGDVTYYEVNYISP
jgi:tRNA-intron endonuclease